MTTTYSAAIDEMFGVVKTAWDAGTTAIVGSVPKLYWPGVEETAAPPAGSYWARVSQQTVSEEQKTLRNGENGQRYNAQGLIFVQIFAPRSDSKAMERLRSLSELVKNTFRGHTSSDNIWFSNSRINELPPESKFYNFNVVSEYQYDEES